MTRVLVVYFTQSGQLLNILKSVLAPLENQSDIEITYEAIRPVKAYPFPWTLTTFFDAMPESVLEIPAKIEKPDFDPNVAYDLIILAYQPWFLSPSNPISSFLQSSYAEKVMKNVPVITINGSRNMWLAAQEKLKVHFKRLQSTLVMNIPFVDRAANWQSVITIPAWMLSGKRQFFQCLPKAGVSDDDVNNAASHGDVILHYIRSGDCKRKKSLTKEHPAEVNPHLISTEKAARRVFRIWAKLIRLMGKPGAWLRKPFLLLFMVYLITVIIIIFPLTFIIYRIKCRLNPQGIQKEVDYYASGD